MGFKTELNSALAKQFGADAGASVVGIASADDFTLAAEGCRPSDVLPGCRSVIVLGVPFPPEALELAPPEYTALRNAILTRMTAIAKAVAKRVTKESGCGAKAISASGGKTVNGKQYGHISLKHAAQLAGLGVITRNYLLTSREYGNLLWLSAVLTDAELVPDPKVAVDLCGGCRKCVDICPVGALDDPAVFGNKKCDRFFVIEDKKFLLKCFQCRTVCPRRFGKADGYQGRRTMDDPRFTAACQAATTADKGMGGIGTLGERTLHMVLKRYMEPDERLHEIKVGGFVADIARTSGIVEIQTRDFSKLRRKLAAFLELGPVTVVYPVAAVKHLRWIDPATGEVGEAHKSPRRGTLSDALPELYKIKSFVTHPNFSLCVAMLELEELHYQNGWSRDGKRGSERCDRIPQGLVGEVVFRAAEDYRAMLPANLPMPFLVKDFKRTAKLSRYQAGLAVDALCSIGAIRVVAKEKNAFVYE